MRPVQTIGAHGRRWSEREIVPITTPHLPLPAAEALEDLAIPSVERIVDTVQRNLG